VRPKLLTALRFLKVAEAACLIAITVFMIPEILYLNRKLAATTDTANEAIASANKLLSAAVPVVNNANDAMVQLSEASKKMNEAAGNETKFLNSETKEIAKVTAAAKELLVFTDKSLNDPKTGAIPAARDALVGTAQLETRAATDLDATTVELQPTLKSFAVSADAFARLVTDPKLKDSIDSANASLVQLQGVATNTNEGSALALKRFKQMLKPASISMQIMKFLAGHAIDGIEGWYFLSH
jgi:hypothetical protein